MLAPEWRHRTTFAAGYIILLVEYRLGHRQYIGRARFSQRLVWDTALVHCGADKRRSVE